MEKKELQITVTPDEGIKTYTILIDGDTLSMVNDKGTIRLNSPGRHIMTWVMFGDAGGKLTIVGEVDAVQIFKKNSKVPSEESAGAGMHRFDI